MTTTGGVRAAIVTGCIVPRDAISNIVLQMADALGRPCRAADGPAVRVRLFTMGLRVHDSRAVEVGSAGELAGHPDFTAADLIVFHYGIRYDAFDAIHLAPRTARVLGYYHGVTPPAVLTPAVRPTAAESYRQAHHLAAADAVMVTSRHLMRDLRMFGVPDENILLVPPAVAVTPVVRPPALADRPVRFLYVGRFVPAKGVAELVEAFRTLAADRPDATLDLAGSVHFSDPAYLAELKAATADLGKRVTFHLDRPSDELAKLYARADVFVLPSRHEGFGVPIVEALAAGCFVVCSDAGACPETAGRLGLVYPVGHKAALADRLRQAADGWEAGVWPTDDGPVPVAEWKPRAAAYAATFSRPAFEDRFRAATLGRLRPASAGDRAFHIDAHRRVLAAARLSTDAGEPGVYQKFRTVLANDRYAASQRPAPRRAA